VPQQKVPQINKLVELVVHFGATASFLTESGTLARLRRQPAGRVTDEAEHNSVGADF